MEFIIYAPLIDTSLEFVILAKKQRKNEKVGDFKRRFNDILSSINRGTYISSSDVTFISLLCNIVDQKYKDGLVSTCTHNRDLQTITQIQKVCSNFCNKPIQKISSADIEHSKEAMRDYSNSVIDKIWILLNRTFKEKIKCYCITIALVYKTKNSKMLILSTL